MMMPTPRSFQMSRYHEMREYSCPADYYEAGKLGSVSPRDIARRRKEEDDERRREEEYVRNKTWGMGINE
jgi:hypothetical protein